MDNPAFFDDGSIVEEAPGRKKFIFWLVIMVSLAVAGGVGLFILTDVYPNPLGKEKKISEGTPILKPQEAPRMILSQKALQKNLDNTVKDLKKKTVTAGASAPTQIKFDDIQLYIDQAGKEPSLDKSYSLYVKVYGLMIIAYKETKDIKYVAAMSNLIKIVVRYPEYKQGDFPPQ